MATVDTERIRANVDLIDLAGRSVELRKAAANEYAGPCPKCGGTDRLHVKKDWFFCRQCYPADMAGVGHDAIGWVRWLDGVDFREACTRLDAGAVATDAPRRAPAPQPKKYLWGDPTWQAETARFVQEAAQRLESPTLGEPARAYLTGRGLLPETWQAWGLGYATPKHPRLEDPRPAICIPWQGRGTVKAVQYRFFWPEIGKIDRFGAKGGGERTLHGVDLLGKHFDTLLLVEGELNALSIWQAARAIGLDRLDVLSFGSDSNAGGDKARELAGRYRRVILWADKPEKTRAAMSALPGARGLRSPKQGEIELDANALLQAGALGDFLAEALARLDRPTAGEIGAALADMARPVLDRLQTGLDWLRDCEERRDVGGDYENVLSRWLGLLSIYEVDYRAAHVVAETVGATC